MNLYEEYKRQLLNSIPVVTGMEIDIKDISPKEISITAPLNTNINYEGTAFGGSINTLCILSSYLLTHHIVKESKLDLKSLVIQDSQIKYITPVQEDFVATATVSDSELKRFLTLLSRKGVGRINVSSVIRTANSQDLVHFKGRFVAQVNC